MSWPQHFSWSFRAYVAGPASWAFRQLSAALFRTNLCARPRVNKPATVPSCVNSKSQGMFVHSTEPSHNWIEILQYVAISCACSFFVFTYCRYLVYFGPRCSTHTTYGSFADQTPVGNSTLSVPVQTAGPTSGKQRSDWGYHGMPSQCHGEIILEQTWSDLSGLWWSVYQMIIIKFLQNNHVELTACMQSMIQ